MDRDQKDHLAQDIKNNTKKVCYWSQPSGSLYKHKNEDGSISVEGEQDQEAVDSIVEGWN